MNLKKRIVLDGLDFKKFQEFLNTFIRSASTKAKKKFENVPKNFENVP